MTWYELKLSDMKLRREISAELKMYKATIDSWFRKRFTSDLVEDNEHNCYMQDRDVVQVVPNVGKHIFWHEVGHSAYYNYNGDSIVIINEFLYEVIGCFDPDDVNKTHENIQTLLDMYYESLGSYHHPDHFHPITIISDLYSMICDYHFNGGYSQHPVGYSKKRFLTNILKDESFATMFAAIATTDLGTYVFIKDTYPEFFNSCLNLIELLKHN